MCEIPVNADTQFVAMIGLPSLHQVEYCVKPSAMGHIGLYMCYVLSSCGVCFGFSTSSHPLALFVTSCQCKSPFLVSQELENQCLFSLSLYIHQYFLICCSMHIQSAYRLVSHVALYRSLTEFK